jgi:hypothetical protein
MHKGKLAVAVIKYNNNAGTILSGKTPERNTNLTFGIIKKTARFSTLAVIDIRQTMSIFNVGSEQWSYFTSRSLLLTNLLLIKTQE